MAGCWLQADSHPTPARVNIAKTAADLTMTSFYTVEHNTEMVLASRSNHCLRSGSEATGSGNTLMAVSRAWVSGSAPFVSRWANLSPVERLHDHKVHQQRLRRRWVTDGGEDLARAEGGARSQRHGSGRRYPFR